MPALFLYPFGPLLLVLHALCAVVLCGSSVHQSVIAVLLLRGRPRPRLQRIYGRVVLASYVATTLIGALLYPRYRYFVRALVLDRHAPWASNLFDLKENLATLGLPLAIGAWLLARDLAPLKNGPTPDYGEAAGGVRWLYLALCLTTAAICVGNTVAGLLCTGVRGI